MSKNLGMKLSENLKQIGTLFVLFSIIVGVLLYEERVIRIPNLTNNSKWEFHHDGALIPDGEGRWGECYIRGTRGGVSIHISKKDLSIYAPNIIDDYLRSDISWKNLRCNAQEEDRNGQIALLQSREKYEYIRYGVNWTCDFDVMDGDKRSVSVDLTKNDIDGLLQLLSSGRYVEVSMESSASNSIGGFQSRLGEWWVEDQDAFTEALKEFDQCTPSSIFK